MFINHDHQLGIESLQKGDLSAALEWLNKALVQNPCHPDIVSDRGFLYIHLKRPELAMEDFDLSLDLQPDYSYRYASRAYAKDYFEDFQGAVEDYHKAIELNANDSVSHNNLGIIYQKMGDPEQAELHFRISDQLRKQDSFEILEEVEGEQKPFERTVIPPSDLIRKQENTISEMKDIFTSKEKFKEFMHFLKYGFRL